MTTFQPSPRASLLAGLRTGGVRSPSLPKVPHTAAPGASFNVPRFISATHQQVSYPEVEENDRHVADMQDVFVNAHSNRVPQPPMTSAVDYSSFSQQQNSLSGMLNGGNPFNPGMATQAHQMQAQAFQMQMMQIEIIRLQAMQAQQYQVELLAQVQQQHQQQSQGWRNASSPPVTNGQHDLRYVAAVNNQIRGNQAEQLRSRLGLPCNDESASTAPNVKYGNWKPGEEEMVELMSPTGTPGRVISGGTVLGSPTSNNVNSISSTQSKSDSAVSWRRNTKSNSVWSGNRAVSVTPTVRVTPPPIDHPSPGAAKSRPQPLRFNVAVSQPLPVIAIDFSETDGDDACSTSSSRSDGSPLTPSSSDSPLSLREEATKKLYEGLGIGRPVPAIAGASPSTPLFKLSNYPSRQPRGPPSGADELGPKNFATRIRRRAIGGLNVLLESRERREVEVC